MPTWRNPSRRLPRRHGNLVVDEDAKPTWSRRELEALFEAGHSAGAIARLKGVSPQRLSQICRRLGLHPKRYWELRQYASRRWPPRYDVHPEMVVAGNWLRSLGYAVRPSIPDGRRSMQFSVAGPTGLWHHVVVHHLKARPVSKMNPRRYYRVRLQGAVAKRHVLVHLDNRVVLLPSGSINTCLPHDPPVMGYWATHFWDSHTATRHVVDHWLLYGELIAYVR